MLDTLFSPLALGPVEIRNRIVSTSHQTSLVHDHLPTADLIAYHETRARGGVGLICIEATATHHTGLLTPHTIGGYLPEIVPVFRRLSDAVHAHGAKIMVQLFHGGREVIASPPRPAAVAPSSVPSPRFKSEPRALSRREIREMIDGYRQAAVHAARAGSTASRCAPGSTTCPPSFCPPRQPAHRRVRRLVREPAALPARGVRGDARGHRPGRRRRLPADRRALVARRQHEDELAEAARVLSDAGLIDYLSVDDRLLDQYRGSVLIVPPSPIEHNAIEPFAGRVREAVAVPVIATGRILDPADADG